jgi:hypothetical protein
MSVSDSENKFFCFDTAAQKCVARLTVVRCSRKPAINNAQGKKTIFKRAP